MRSASSTSSTTANTTTLISTLRSDEPSKLMTMSASERASNFSLLHTFAWFLLFTTLTMTTVVLLNWCLRSRQSAVDKEEEKIEEEMSSRAFVLPSSSPTQDTLAEGSGSASSSSNRLLASRGNLARQQFLESRKAGGNVKTYGGTDPV